MKMKISSGGVPAGTYYGEFTGVEAIASDPARGYGAGLRWQFQIVSGENKGMTVGRITGESPTLRNACGRILSQISGKALASGAEIDLNEYLGRKYLVVVAPTESGATRVETVTFPPE